MKRQLTILAAGCFAMLLIMPVRGLTHCDTLDGPVVSAARIALDKGDITPVLKWVRSDDEKEIRDLFGKASAARKSGPESQEIADRYFFETLVRPSQGRRGCAVHGIAAGTGGADHCGCGQGPAGGLDRQALEAGNRAGVGRHQETVQ